MQRKRSKIVHSNNPPNAAIKFVVCALSKSQCSLLYMMQWWSIHMNWKRLLGTGCFFLPGGENIWSIARGTWSFFQDSTMNIHFSSQKKSTLPQVLVFNWRRCFLEAHTSKSLLLQLLCWVEIVLLPFLMIVSFFLLVFSASSSFTTKNRII